MSLLFVLTHDRLGGAERIVLELAERSRADRQDVHLATLYGSRQGPLARQFGKELSRLREVFFGTYTTIHTHLFLPGLLVSLRRLCDKSFRWVHTVHYVHEGLRFSWFKEWVDTHLVFGRADTLVAVSAHLADRLRGRYPQVVCIENGVPPMEVKLRARPDGKSVVVGCVSMFRSEKSIEVLIEAIARLGEAGAHLELRIAGDGPRRKILEKMVADLGLKERVHFLGFVEDVAAFYSTLDLYVQPSGSETFGIALWEAMQCHLPLVAFRAGNVPRLFGDGAYGEMAEWANSPEEGLGTSILRVASELKAYSAKAAAGHAHWKEHLSVERMAREYQRLYANRKHLRVWMIAPIITHSSGGMQKQLLLQSRQLSALGAHVSLLQQRDAGLENDLEKARTWAHVTILSTPSLPWMSERLRGVAFILFGFMKMWIHRGRVDVLHAHQLYSPTLLAALGKWLLKIPVVVKMTASGVLGEARELQRLPFLPIRKMAFKKVDRLIVLTGEMRDEAAGLGFSPSQILELPNGVVVPPAGVTAPEAPLASNEPFRLVYCGRLSTEKSIDTLIEAADLLARTTPVPIRLDIVGAPFAPRDPSPELHRLAEGCRDRVQVVFHGHQEDVTSFYKASPVFVLPSQSEGMSNALLEAMALGLCCVVSDIAPNRVLVEHGVSGLLFKQGDSASLADALGRILRCRLEGGALCARLMAGAREKVASRYSAEVIGKRILDLYHQVLPQQP